MDKLSELVEGAKAIIAGTPDKNLLWRAYVMLEYAIMDVKLRYNLEGETQPEKPAKKAIDITNAREILERIELSGDKRILLYNLRRCRDLVKALVARYDLRSTTS